MDEEHHANATLECFQDDKLTPKDVHCIHESMLKNGKETMRSKYFYSSVDWDMLSSKPNKSKNETKCECQKEPCVDKHTYYNRLFHIECEENCIFATACDNKIRTKKQVKKISWHLMTKIRD